MVLGPDDSPKKISAISKIGRNHRGSVIKKLSLKLGSVARPVILAYRKLTSVDGGALPSTWDLRKPLVSGRSLKFQGKVESLGCY